MKILVEEGADLMQVKAADGFTPLHIAASTNDAPLIDFIIK
jgi:ankyrin repeat protein